MITYLVFLVTLLNDSFPSTRRHEKSANYFDLIFIDMWKAPILSFHGDCYFLSIIVDKVHFSWIFYHKSKDQTLYAFKKFSLFV